MTDVPPLPAGMDAFAVQKRDGSETYAVSTSDAARLIGRSTAFVSTWITKGTVEVCEHPVHGRLILVDSLWAAIPDEVKA